jgi:hypothetical protein
MECALVSKTIFAPRKISSLAVTLSSCRWLARRVLSMVGALPHQPKPGHYFTSDIDASLLTPSSVAADARKLAIFNIIRGVMSGVMRAARSTMVQRSHTLTDNSLRSLAPALRQALRCSNR